MLTDTLLTQNDHLLSLIPNLAQAIDRLENATNLTLAQGALLAATALELRPQVVLDIGTGGGSSAVSFALAACSTGSKIYTFDLYPNWDVTVRPKLVSMLQNSIDDIVLTIVGDIGTFDFGRIINTADRVIVFWDAHGYAIAERILSHIMPLIADKRHVVICHDISDNRIRIGRAYQGQGFWRGVDGACQLDTALINLAKFVTKVERTSAGGTRSNCIPSMRSSIWSGTQRKGAHC